MELYHLTALLLLWIHSTLSSPAPLDIMIGRCRVNCLEVVMTYPTNDEKCGENPDCLQCWENCEQLFRDYPVWGAMCHTQEICHSGCQAACKYRGNIPSRKMQGSVWVFPDDPHIEKRNNGFLYLKWSAPQPISDPSSQQHLVYILMINNGHQWMQHLESISTEALLDPRYIHYTDSTQFKVIAVHENGTAAEITFMMPPVPSATSGMIIGKTSPPTPAPGGSTQMPRKRHRSLNVSVAVEPRGNNLYGKVSWNQIAPQNVKNRHDVLYNVDWASVSRNVDSTYPHCTIPNDHSATALDPTNEKMMYFELGKLTFNSQFWIEITRQAPGRRPKTERVEFSTPGCMKPDETFTQCLDTDTTKIKPAVWELNMTSVKYDVRQGRFAAVLSWPAPVSYEDVEYKLFLHSTSQGNKTEVLFREPYSTRNTHISVLLHPNAIYNIQVVADFNTSDGKRHTLWSSKIFCNTSEAVNTTVTQWKLASRLSDSSHFNAVITTSTVITVIILLLLVIIILYKRCESFREVIISNMKTGISKSNSYKSSLGGGGYSQELMMVRDEWELDLRELKVGGVLGQGAFGKVLSGFHIDKKVAIKTLKDNVPPSYKDDLLAEITLMKKIGQHANIVSLVGACTVAEPVALVMEYVPYGNLQSFLKHCRAEGELVRSAGKDELAYAMTAADGQVTNWTVTPSDMLSFARQVAMAMEYLASKQYVHRDLAARNVLVADNKLVKVCDFGLSRDVYQDNEYHKLTNGKLPLKWMALESLHERVFTTNSDVWSYGILLWEIVTMGASPYPNIALADLYSILARGYRMDKPANCSDEVYEIMRKCWVAKPSDRPSFTQLCEMVENLLSKDCDYLDLQNIDVPLTNESDSSSSSINITISPSGSEDTVSLKSKLSNGALSRSGSRRGSFSSKFSRHSFRSRSRSLTSQRSNGESLERLLDGVEGGPALPNVDTIDYSNLKRKLQELKSTHI